MLPDWLTDPPDDEVCDCGAPALQGWDICKECLAEMRDMYADEKISEGRYRR